MALRIGLTGGIGSGKSTVAAMLVAEGAGLVDTDAIARALAAPGGAAMPAIEAAFGAEALDAQGGLDRARMRERAFTDPGAKSRLEAILHPLIGEECDRQAARLVQAAHPAVVFDVPLLVESRRWRARVDRVLVVDATHDTQIARVMARSGWTDAAVRRVLDLQAQREHRRAAADAIIYNESLALDALALQVRAIWQRWTRSTR